MAFSSRDSQACSREARAWSRGGLYLWLLPRNLESRQREHSTLPPQRAPLSAASRASLRVLLLIHVNSKSFNLRLPPEGTNMRRTSILHVKWLHACQRIQCLQSLSEKERLNGKCFLMYEQRGSCITGELSTTGPASFCRGAQRTQPCSLCRCSFRASSKVP